MKKPLNRLFLDQPDTPEGKYLVKRRDGTVVEWPHFVLGARDPDGANTLRFYALLKLMPEAARAAVVTEVMDSIKLWLLAKNGLNKEFVESVMRNADRWDEYRAEHGDGDPMMGPHRVDDPATIAEMKNGYSA